MEAQEAEFEVVKREPEKAEPEVFHGMGMLTPEILKRAEAAVEMVKKVKALALKVTNQRDWVRFGDKAYLTESGCKKVGALFGTSFRGMRVVESNTVTEGKPVRTYTAEVTVDFHGREVTEIGTCDSDYDLYRWQDRKAGVEMPFGERDFTSMKKHSVTNAMNRAMKSILGLNGILWDEAMAALGGKAGEVAQVSFKESAPRTAQTVASADGASLKDNLWKMLMDMASGDESKAGALLTQYSAFDKEGKHYEYKGAIIAMKDGWAGATYKKVKTDWEAAGLGGPPEPGSNG